MYSQLNGNINKQTSDDDNPKPTTIQNQRVSQIQSLSKSKAPIQSSPDCHLIRAFVAHPILGYTCCTPASHYLLRRQNRQANITGRGLDPLCVSESVCVCV